MVIDPTKTNEDPCRVIRETFVPLGPLLRRMVGSCNPSETKLFQMQKFQSCIQIVQFQNRELLGVLKVFWLAFI